MKTGMWISLSCLLHLKKPSEERQHEQLVQVAHLSASAKQHSPTAAVGLNVYIPRKYGGKFTNFISLPSAILQKCSDVLVQQKQRA